MLQRQECVRSDALLNVERNSSCRDTPSCRYISDKGVPFYPNPFLPLLCQRRIALLGTQMQCFPGKHILFGRSWGFQGATGPTFRQSAQTHRMMRPCRLANDVEICLNLIQVSNPCFNLFVFDYGKDQARNRQNSREKIEDAVVKHRPHS